MKLLFKKFIGFSLGPVIGALISFITIPLTTYFVSPIEYGKASMFVLFQGLLVTFLYLGLDQSYTREYHESKDKTNLLKNAMLIPITIALLMLICIFGNLKIVSSFLFGSGGYSTATLLFGLSIIFMVIERFILLSIRMEEKALEYSMLNIVLKLNVLIFTLIFVLLVRNDFLAVVYSTVLGQIIADIFLIFRYKKYLDFTKIQLDKGLIFNLLKFGIPLIFAASFNNLLNSLDRLALRTWSNFHEIGIFTAALKISAILTIIQTSFTSFWVPTAYRWYNEKKDIKHFELISKIILLMMSTLLCLILIFKEFIIKLLGYDYTDAKFLIGILCLYPIMYTISETTTLGITFSRKSYYNIWVSVLSIIPNVFLNFLLIPKYGAVGAAIATGVSYIIFFIARSFFSNRNWIGFSFKFHLLISLLLLFVTILNTQKNEYIFLINSCFLLLIIALQIPTIKKIFAIYKNKDNQDWDFS
ncbi:lipopolysaccharide biosynthesis protein [Bacillus sp. SJS]|uniref:lipopolysaccharide biosynthesis protein n=1 Tax=Bacillus sp. SJS TaxID=1423321 RepID=UPI0004DCC2C9|nr:oligosaccharide flippase family protein [Bacillus sp. SJS]KZZ83905.1 polysaccharide biosynthesis protein [Bacillus sp. SJS]